MATIELDIIKQRSDKLTPEEKLELIDFLTNSLSAENAGNNSNSSRNNTSDDTEGLSASLFITPNN